jgi:hypothetical protein
MQAPRNRIAMLSICMCGALAATGMSAQNKSLSSHDRAAAISRASVWSATNVETMDLRAGPQGKGAFPPMAEVSCTYVEKKDSGNSPKFSCELAPGDVVKVKYGENNGEVYGVVAASRLLWALGFGADRWYPVSVTCHGCPADPMKGGKPALGDTTFPIAAIERKFPGKTIETHPDEGWDWHELSLVSEKNGGAPLAHREALELLAALIQHTDNKPEQQTIVCPPGDPGENGKAPCAQPFMYIHDVGLTFGRATMLNNNSTSGANLLEWSKAGVWKDAKRCVAKLPQSLSGSLGDPTISEAGRKFLADLLVRLSDQQLRDLFEVARFPERAKMPVDAWIAAFNAKRETIVRASCPS